jgi:hypothetical protein
MHGGKCTEQKHHGALLLLAWRIEGVTHVSGMEPPSPICSEATSNSPSLDSFSKGAREIFEHFKSSEFIGQLQEANLLFKVVQQVATTDLSPKAISSMRHPYAEARRRCRRLQIACTDRTNATSPVAPVVSSVQMKKKPPGS